VNVKLVLPSFITKATDFGWIFGHKYCTHTWAPDFFQGGGVKFVNPIFNGQFFSKKIKNKISKIKFQK
jgi:hypothetical protein